MAQYGYDLTHDPPAPLLPVRIGPPGGEPFVLLPALVDTGADVSVVPETIARQIRLPVVGEVSLRGMAGTMRRAELRAALMEIEGAPEVFEVVSLGEEALLGRDVLNWLILTLDGPRNLLESTRP